MAELIRNDRRIESKHELLALIQEMGAEQFEYFVADLWSELGWQTQVTQQSNDEGVDIYAEKSHPYERGVAIQAKRYGDSSVVGRTDAQQYVGALMGANADEIVIVTTGEFAQTARDYAEEVSAPLKLVDGQDLADLLVAKELEHLISNYVHGVEVVTDPIEEIKMEAANFDRDELVTGIDKRLIGATLLFGASMWVIVGMGIEVASFVLLMSFVAMGVFAHQDVSRLPDRLDYPPRWSIPALTIVTTMFSPLVIATHLTMKWYITLQNSD